MTKNQYKKWYLKQLRAYERITSSIVKKHLKNTLIKVAKQKPTQENYKILLEKEINNKAILKMLLEVYETVGVIHGNKIYRGINDNTMTVKAFSPALFIKSFGRAVFEFLTLFGGENITSIKDTFVEAVINYIAERNDTGKSIQVITNEMVRKFGTKTGLYKWQIMRITRTETGAAANFASNKAMEDADVVVDKMWISADDHRVRNGSAKGEYNHEAMNGITIPYDKYFEVPQNEGDSDRVKHPIDIRGKAGNIINCRCTTAPVPRRDKNGRLVLKKNN